MKIRKFNPTEKTVHDLIKAEAENQNINIWDVQYEKEGAGWYLRIYIEKDGGLTMDDCENFTRPVNKLLDEADPIPQSYMLEIGSPGLERKLLRESHFESSIGSPVTARAIRDFDGEKEITGILNGFDKEEITLALSGETKNEEEVCSKLPLSDIAYVKLYEDFEELHQK